MFGLRLLALQTTSAVAFISRPLLSAPPCHHKIATTQARSFRATTALGGAGNQFLLRYDYIPDVLEKRAPHREGHIDLAKKAVGDGLLLSAGPTFPVGEEVPIGALFIFTDLDAAKKFAEEDPYTLNGIVTRHSIEEWNVVVQKE